MKRLAAFAASLMALASVSHASAQSIQLTAVDIVDTPRPIERWGYAPRMSAVALGTWVTWSNTGDDAHTVTAIDGAFDSAELQPSEGFSWYFDVPGTFEYYCVLHDWMLGRVVVEGVLSEPEAPAEDPQ